MPTTTLTVPSFARTLELVRSQTAFEGVRDLRKMVTHGYRPTIRGDESDELRELRLGLIHLDIPVWPDATHDELAQVAEARSAFNYQDGLQHSFAGKLPRPGDRVRGRINSVGAGTVVDLFVECGWIGVRVALDSVPDWANDEQRERAIGADGKYVAHLFGAEIDLIP